MPTLHRLDPKLDTVHWGFFDAELPARLEVASGDTDAMVRRDLPGRHAGMGL